jgi:hypothetical protein
MTEFQVDSFSAFHDVIRQNHAEWRRWFYRGHASPKYQLLPRAGRPPYSNIDDQRMLEAWKRHAVAHLGQAPRHLNDWDYLAIAQHHGLATRLLDWTFNALAAAFFGLVKSDGIVDENEDAVVYGHYSKQEPINPVEDIREPFKLPDGVHRLAPSSLVPRISRQGGIFSVHSPRDRRLDQPLPDGDKLLKIVIPAGRRKQFAIELSHYGVNRMSLFPDLDGLSMHINWSFTHLPYG